MAVNWLPFLGYLSISFGPSVTLFSLVAASEAQAVILWITSAFFWLLSLLLTSLLWLAVVPLKDYVVFTLVFSVFFQEGFRVLFILMVRVANTALSRISRDTADLFHGPRYSLIAGLGYGAMSAMFMYVNVLSEASGPGTIYSDGKPSLPIFLTGALLASAMTGLHVCWGVLSSEAVEKRNWRLGLIVVLSHLFASSMTVMNEYKISPIYSILSTYATLGVIGSFTFHRAKGQIQPFFKLR